MGSWSSWKVKTIIDFNCNSFNFQRFNSFDFPTCQRFKCLYNVYFNIKSELLRIWNHWNVEAVASWKVEHVEKLKQLMKNWNVEKLQRLDSCNLSRLSPEEKDLGSTPGEKIKSWWVDKLKTETLNSWQIEKLKRLKCWTVGKLKCGKMEMNILRSWKVERSKLLMSCNVV